MNVHHRPQGLRPVLCLLAALVGAASCGGGSSAAGGADAPDDGRGDAAWWFDGRASDGGGGRKDAAPEASDARDGGPAAPDAADAGSAAAADAVAADAPDAGRADVPGPSAADGATDAASDGAADGATAADGGADVPAPVASCAGVAAGVPCDDADPCTAGERCDGAGLCSGGQSLCDPFTVVLLPDTQYYTSRLDDDPDNTYYKQMQWIIDHRTSDDIRFVIHLGDVTNTNTTAQWLIADEAHAMLDEAGVPYSVVPGNHDYLEGGRFSRSASRFDDYFGPDRFQDQPFYGGALGSGNMNNYTYFEAGAERFLVLSLEFAPEKDALCWADEVIAAHPDHRVIVVTHCFLTRGGGYASSCMGAGYDVPGADGRPVWDELASRHSNVFLVVSGHIGASEHEARTGNAGNTVHQMVVDYQFEAACSAATPAQCTNHCWANFYTGNGWLRELVFSPREGRVQARTVTVEAGNTSIFPGGEPVFFCSGHNTEGDDYYAADPAAPDHDFEFAYDLRSSVFYARDDGGRLAFRDRTVNSLGTGDQLAPRVALHPDGGFVAVWEDDALDGDGAGNHDVLVRGFLPGGCADFADGPVHVDPAGQQRAPSLAMDAAGGFVVAWEDDTDGNGSFQIHARGFAADGSERLPEFVVNGVPAGQQRRPAVALAPDGRFVVAWEDDQDRDGVFEVLVRGFGADGLERFSERAVESEVGEGQRLRPAVALDADAGFVVAWQDDTDGNGLYQIRARAFTADGSPRFDSVTVNSVASGQQTDPAIGVDAGGAFVVAWADDDDGTQQVLARAFHADGSERLPDWRVPARGSAQTAPALAMAPDGRFVLTWQDDADDDGAFGLRVRGYRANGEEWLPEETVNRDPDGQHLAPHVALNAAGRLVVVWQDDMDDNGFFEILARGLDGPP